MNTYLVIITTVLVMTQIIRVMQNTIQLRRQKKEFEDNLGWLKKRDVTEEDFDTQRKAFRLAAKYFERQMKICKYCAYRGDNSPSSPCTSCDSGNSNFEDKDDE